MTDQTIPAGLTREEAQTVREWAERSLTMWDPDVPVSKAARVVLAVLPKRLTLADMTEEERRAHIGATAELCGELVIISDMDADHVRVVTEGFNPQWPELTSVTPRPDLPRFTWPTDTPAPVAAPVPPNTLAEGSEWDNVDALARACEESGRDQIIVSGQDGYAFIWDGMADWWEGSTPPRAAPFTILHTGHETDW